MKLRLLALAATAASALISGSANAAMTITFSALDWSMNAGEIEITQFQGGPTLGGTTFDIPGFGLTGTAQLFTGSVDGVSAAPAVPSSASVYDASTGRDGTQYLSIQGGQTATLTIGGAGLSELSFYVGSLDTYNTLSFHYSDGTSGPAINGQTVADMTAVSQANGNQQSGDTNGRLTFTFDKPIDSVTLGSNQNAFEISQVAGIAAAVPEPASWALMIVGIGATGAVLRTQRRQRLVPVRVRA